MSLEQLRKKAIYQNTIDAWIAACEEKNIDWYETENYKKFIAFLNKNNLKMPAVNLSEDETKQSLPKLFQSLKTQMPQHILLN